ncbi:MAG: carboxypeptidase regulatory-like domain-containing protein [Fuerstiella sp.]|jgi:hypothetical protein
MRRLPFILLVTLVLMGCGDSRLKTVPVSGKVVFPDGSPARTGTIEFESRDFPITATGQISPDGSFVLGTYESNDGAVAGFHQVIILQMVINDGTINHSMDHGKMVDPKFATYGLSGLNVMVDREKENYLVIEVTSVTKK